ncbi:MAG: polysaccharide biosynthesis/export family protein [Candidatus Omnitrophota bacterium]
MDGRLTITDVAKTLGVTPRTIMRWEKTGKIRRSKRDWRGWRFYLKDDLDDIRKFYESSYEYNESIGAGMSFAKSNVMSVIISALAIAASIIPCGAVYGGTAAAQGAQKPAYYTEAGPAQGNAVRETKTAVDINLAVLPVVSTPPATVAEASKYTLGPDDVIQVEVRRHPEFSGQYTVTAEGKIEYKFVGDIVVDGLTKAQLQERLSAILSEYVIEPEVNVQIMAYLSKVFYVVGEVNKPGKFYMKGNTVTVREALVQAGLPNTAASTRKCRLISPSSKGKGTTRYINVYELLYAGDLKENIEMQPGDVLYIPSTVIAKIIRVISPVTNFAGETAGHVAQGAGIAAGAL